MKRILCFFLLSLLGTIAAQESPSLRLATTFGDHMVLQREAETAVWGSASPGSEVSVSFAGQIVSGKADEKGEWKVRLAGLTANKTGRELMVQAGEQKVTLSDVVVGDVWMCSGQSNMAFKTDRALGWEEESKTADLPLLRLFTTPNATAAVPQRDITGGLWAVSSSSSAGQFSAVGYYFGKELATQLDIPIGMICSAWGGKPSEAFTSIPRLESVPAARRLVDEWHAKSKSYDPEKERANYQVQLTTFEARRRALVEAKKKGENPPRLGRAPSPPVEPMLSSNAPGAIYHQMIAPWTPFAIRGAIWYQGESNQNRARQYESIFPAMIEDWREKWNNPKLPFYFVQIANFREPSTEPGTPSAWAELQNAQTLTLKKLPHTGMAIINDLGEAKDIHPRNKKDVSLRLARWALSGDYGKPVDPVSGPLLGNFEITDQGIRVTFDHVGEGLKSRDGGELKRFEMAGEDRRWHWASATIEAGAKSVLIACPEVKKPLAARYAWAANPEGANLVNSAGLPASLFRTDDWPLATEGFETLADGAIVDAASLAATHARLESLGFTVLFNGKDLTGWRNPYDWGQVSVQNGEIHLAGEKKFFLMTEKTYRDFILTAEIKLPEGKANSGVMFRAHVEPNKVYGYQAECDGSERRWSGGLYDEGRRQWIWPSQKGRTTDEKFLAHESESQAFMKKPEIAEALKRNDWNRYQITCRGDQIQIRLNGVLVTDLKDDTDAEGYIGIQHHGEKGAIYKFRNIFIKELK